MTKKAILLINVGTPDQCDAKSVHRYLKEFLSDPRVIDLPSYIRWPLLNGIILPLRYKKTTSAYQKIWQEDGSPQLVNSIKMTKALAAELGDDYQVELGMRYGQPSLQSAFDKIKSANSILILPLFPQYSSAATGSALQMVLTASAKQWNIPHLFIQKDFYQHQAFITAYASLIREHLQNKNIDFILFSYHGLPERHIRKSQCKATCDKIDECPIPHVNNQYCYRAQCFMTTKLIVQELGLSPDQFSISFQSRLGVRSWIKPYTDMVLPKLQKKKIKNIAVVCPSFVADCLETLEEINIRARKQWQKLGGEDFTFIPCLNDSKPWIKALAEIAREHLS